MNTSIVLDTNVLISGLFWKGNEHRILQLINQKRVKLIISKEIILELQHVLHRQKFSRAIKQAKTTPTALIQLITSQATIITPTININICRDVKDNKFIECATTGKAKYIVSGDTDLLSLHHVDNIPIVNPKEFLSRIGKT